MKNPPGDSLYRRMAISPFASMTTTEACCNAIREILGAGQCTYAAGRAGRVSFGHDCVRCCRIRHFDRLRENLDACNQDYHSEAKREKSCAAASKEDNRLLFLEVNLETEVIGKWK